MPIDQRLLKEPKWRPEDLGAPLPASIHANSVCLPEWRDVVDYEEKNPRVIQRLQAGYPRFVVPALCAQFFELCRQRFAREGELCHAYPSERAARRCVSLINRWCSTEARIVPWGDRRVFVVCFPAAAEPSALKYWRHTGDGISSRQAAALLNGKSELTGSEARRRILQRISKLSGMPEDCIYLFKSGMAAIYTLHRAAVLMHPGGACVQFGFPYVDTLKILQDFGQRSAFFPLGNKNDMKMLTRLTSIDRISAIFCEFPSNPLLISPDLRALANLGKAGSFPIIVDDTLATWANLNLFPAADVVVTSLTKYFTGQGDVMGGVAVLNPNSPCHHAIKAALKAEYEDTLWGDNLVLMDQYSVDFPERMKKVNRTAELVCDWLHTRPEVQTVYYPKFQSRAHYDQFRQPNGGYSGLFSLLLKNPETASAKFYDNLEISKGPNLGTIFSLCCPFTMLAHYDELDWAERCGVSRHLLRFSIGLEEPEDLIGRLERAFNAIR